ncbi:terminase small subunit [Limosilactobacillus vaginalis]|uniref:terminase small subunit n=1 Tax=Limosilactobacillus vaginalis TaxID=1633 RepID=UPI0024BBC7DA|nr:terminase small subunit [Limosilactobacillus vaginalis]
MRLTTKQRLFADEYIKSGNATQSAIKAGYATKAAYRTGSENLRKPQIKAYIDAKMTEIESHKIADAKEVLQFYTRVLREEETEEVALPAGDDVVTVEKKPSFKDRLTAAKELMKRYPLSDPMVQAQLKKITADARVAEARAKALEDNGQDMELLLDKMLDKVEKEDKQNGTEQSADS